MKTFVVVTVLALTVSMSWARPNRRSGREASVTRIGNPGHADARSRLAAARTARPNAAPPAAPGVVQVHREEGFIFAFFTATSVIPANSTIGGYISVYNAGEVAGSISFDDVQLNADMGVGDYIFLPNFSSVGDMWPTGVLVYTVDVTINGALTEANGEILINQALGYGDLPNFAPIITGTGQSLASNGDTILNIYGVFTGDTPLVVLDVLVAPARAIRVISSSQIAVDLSLVPGFDLPLLSEYMLTVSQAGYADTTIYRFVPMQP